jgi:hypothetical protein
MKLFRTGGRTRHRRRKVGSRFLGGGFGVCAAVDRVAAKHVAVPAARSGSPDWNFERMTAFHPGAHTRHFEWSCAGSEWTRQAGAGAVTNMCASSTQ